MLRKPKTVNEQPILVSEETPAPIETMLEPAAMPEPKATDMERLRDILFGSQTRSIEKHLGELELRLEETRREMTDQFNQKLSGLADSATARLSESYKDLNDKLETQNTQQTIQLKTIQKELTERIDRQIAEQAAQLRAVHKELSDQLDKINLDIVQQLRALHKELNDRIDRLGGETAERTRDLQAEARQRDDSLHQEILNLATVLDDKKASRQDLGQMLVELGLRLGNHPNTPKG